MTPPDENPFRSPQTIDEEPVEAEVLDAAGPRSLGAPNSLMVAWFLNLGLVPLHLIAVAVMGPWAVGMMILAIVALFTMLARRPWIGTVVIVFFRVEVVFFAMAAGTASTQSAPLTTMLMVCLAATMGIVVALALPSARKYYGGPWKSVLTADDADGRR